MYVTVSERKSFLAYCFGRHAEHHRFVEQHGEGVARVEREGQRDPSRCQQLQLEAAVAGAVLAVVAALARREKREPNAHAGGAAAQPQSVGQVDFGPEKREKSDNERNKVDFDREKRLTM